MPKKSGLSKAVAVIFVVLTVSAVAAMITMAAVYKIWIDDHLPTIRPTDSSTTTPPPPVMRLPKNLIPLKYEIFLWPRLYNKTSISDNDVITPNQMLHFTGNSTVFFKCVQNTSSIYLHSKDLKVTNELVKNNNKHEGVDILKINRPSDGSDFFQVKLHSSLTAGETYSLSLDFEGELSENMEGLYISSYVEGTPEYEGDPNVDRELNDITVRDKYTLPLINTAFDSLHEATVFTKLDLRSAYNLVQEHRVHVRRVLHRLLENQLYIKAEKCEFHTVSTTFLGFVISHKKIIADQEKVKTVVEWPVPSSRKQLQQLLGFASFYRSFVKDHSIIALPLTRLTSTEVPFRWTEKAEAAFVKLKSVFSSPPILAQVEPSLQCLMEVDASDFGVGAVLSHRSPAADKKLPADKEMADILALHVVLLHGIPADIMSDCVARVHLSSLHPLGYNPPLFPEEEEEIAMRSRPTFLAVTNLKPTDARRVFPCFDEPEMKAEFQVTIIHRQNSYALANRGKGDQIALPDLSSVAMENWGLITYQEEALLYEEGVSSVMQKEVIATVIAHELAHQWFGNVVTMSWWNDIWLNEGFANYMSYFALDDLKFSVKDIHIMGDLHSAFEEDALASSHPLSPPAGSVLTSDEIIRMFDSISYNKGAMVLRMLADHVGETIFKNGIKMYLRELQFTNATQSDFWAYMQKAYNDNRSPNKNAVPHADYENIPFLMEPWTKQAGYPVITINTTKGSVFQKHFLFNTTVQSSRYWPVFISSIKSTSSEPKKDLLPDGTPVFKEGFIAKPGEWILANVNCTGYYRVNYNPENWKRLLTQLQANRDRIPLMNRGQLIDDAFNLARAKQVNVTLALNLTRYLIHERDYLPWESAVRNLEYFIFMFDRSEVYGPMQVYLREQVEGLYDSLMNYTDNSTMPKDDHTLQRKQMLAIEVACSNGLPSCVEMAKKEYSDWMNSNTTNRIDPNLRSVIYCQAVAAGGKEEWEFAWNKYQSTSSTSEKQQLRRALSCTKTTWLLSRYLDYILDPKKIRLMDVASTINDIARNSAGQELAWNFIRAHWNYVSQGDGSFLIKGVTKRFSTQFELKELEHFAVKYDVGAVGGTLSQAIEQTRVNMQWVKENKDTVLRWFEMETSDAA
ncbi:aminopeptidase N-like [Pholidichthys leucotaenia]